MTRATPRDLVRASLALLADSAWTLRYDADRGKLIGKAAPTALVLGGRSLGTHTVSGATAIKWSQVSVRNLGSGG